MMFFGVFGPLCLKKFQKIGKKEEEEEFHKP